MPPCHPAHAFSLGSPTRCSPPPAAPRPGPLAPRRPARAQRGGRRWSLRGEKTTSLGVVWLGFFGEKGFRNARFLRDGNGWNDVWSVFSGQSSWKRPLRGFSLGMDSFPVVFLNRTSKLHPLTWSWNTASNPISMWGLLETFKLSVCSEHGFVAKSLGH